MNEAKFELTRDEVRALAGEVLAAIGVEQGQMDEEEREVLRKAVEEWRRRRNEDIERPENSTVCCMDASLDALRALQQDGAEAGPEWGMRNEGGEGI